MDDASDPVRGRRAQHHRGAGGVDAVKVGAVARPELGDAREVVDMPDILHGGIELPRIEDRSRNEFDARAEIIRARKIEDADRRTARAQRRHHMAADEARAAGNEINRHGLAPARLHLCA